MQNSPSVAKNCKVFFRVVAAVAGDARSSTSVRRAPGRLRFGTFYNGRLFTFHLEVEGFRMGWWMMCRIHPRWRKNSKFFFKSSRPSPGMLGAPPRLGGRRVGSVLVPSKMGACSLSTLKLKVLGWDGGRCAKFTLGGEKIQSFLGQVEASNLSLRFDS